MEQKNSSQYHKMKYKSFLPLAICFLSFFFSPSYAHNKSHNNEDSSSSSSLRGSNKDCFSKIYAFGDSYTDTGNAYWLGGLTIPVGATSGKPANPPPCAGVTNSPPSSTTSRKVATPPPFASVTNSPQSSTTPPSAGSTNSPNSPTTTNPPPSPGVTNSPQSSTTPPSAGSTNSPNSPTTTNPPPSPVVTNSPQSSTPPPSAGSTNSPNSPTTTNPPPSVGATNSTHSSTTDGKPANRLSDGRLVIDFVCESLSLPPLPPYKDSSANFTHGCNFAIAGSTSLSSDYFIKETLFKNLVWKGIPMSLQTQIDWFTKFRSDIGCKGKDSRSCNAEMENTLFWIGGMGISDYVRTSKGSLISFQSLTDMSISHVSKLLETLLGGGAKYIVVQGLPPVGCLPIAISLCPLHKLDRMGCSVPVNAAIMFHNQILQKKLQKLQKQYPHCSIIYADYWNAFLTILTNLKKFGFDEPLKACCGAGGGNLNFNMETICGSPGTSTCTDPSKHISWDGIHLTEAMNKQLTDLLLNQGFCQPSFSDLIKSKSGI
ncbi:unnamed protein product [Ilex paraguariensis]|uniref:Uncharacterized protein n=1 Tax=Ilex paraguariensis TaxID=185542 RepID=A0ABC8TSC3_9AQUA